MAGACCGTVTNSEETMKTTEKVIKMVWSKYDKDGNGVLDRDEVFDLLHDSEMKNYPMVAGTGSSTFDNLVAGHAYTILGTQIIYDNGGNVVERLVRMRNPWGKFMYTGPWSGHSDDWTPAYKA